MVIQLKVLLSIYLLIFIVSASEQTASFEHLRLQNYQKIYGAPKTTIVLLYSKECGKCKAAKNAVADLSKFMDGVPYFQVFGVNCIEENMLCKRLGGITIQIPVIQAYFMGGPTAHIYGGEIQDRASHTTLNIDVYTCFC